MWQRELSVARQHISAQDKRRKLPSHRISTLKCSMELTEKAVNLPLQITVQRNYLLGGGEEGRKKIVLKKKRKKKKGKREKSERGRKKK